jgi:hypothetical protein
VLAASAMTLETIGRNRRRSGKAGQLYRMVDKQCFANICEIQKLING